MKRIGVFLLVLCMCAGFAACGSGPEQTSPPAAVQELPEETIGTPEKKPPEDISFREADYTVIESTAQDGTKLVEYYTKDPSNSRVRFYCEYPDGVISDEYYYPSGSMSHSFWYLADGSGSGFYYEEDGTIIKSIHEYPDGEHGEDEYYENGNIKRSVSANTVTGASREQVYYENGNLKTMVSDDPSTGVRQESGYFENGNLQYTKEQGADYAFEQRYDEEGFLTYSYSKRVGSVIEYITDETGALVKYIENGEIIEDPETLASLAEGYKFRK